jgi:hypothetical protein
MGEPAAAGTSALEDLSLLRDSPAAEKEVRHE